MDIKHNKLKTFSLGWSDTNVNPDPECLLSSWGLQPRIHACGSSRAAACLSLRSCCPSVPGAANPAQPIRRSQFCWSSWMVVWIINLATRKTIQSIKQLRRFRSLISWPAYQAQGITWKLRCHLPDQKDLLICKPVRQDRQASLHKPAVVKYTLNTIVAFLCGGLISGDHAEGGVNETGLWKDRWCSVISQRLKRSQDNPK